jgi:hypothetical protein
MSKTELVLLQIPSTLLKAIDLEQLEKLSDDTNDNIDSLIEFLDEIFHIEVLILASGCWSFVNWCVGAQLPTRVRVGQW